MGNPQRRNKDDKLEELPRINERANSFLAPIKAFDGGASNQSSATSLAISLSQLDRQVFIFDCMLEHICSIYEKDKSQQKRMYEALRKYFVASQLLPPDNYLPEMNGSRIQVKLGLSSLFNRIHSRLMSNNEPEGVQNSITMYRPNNTWCSTNDGNELFFSRRYETDFDEIEFIAAGGFGVVYKARNIVDYNVYAIKKILVGPSASASKVVREVQLLSRLQHPNVVAYKSAWFEFPSSQVIQGILERIGGTTTSSHETNSVNVETFSSSEYSYTDTSLLSKIGDGESKFFRNSHRSVSRSWTSFPISLLYVQMQFCNQTLRQWLNNRNRQNQSALNGDINKELNIIRQILQGIDYIHKNGIIHRDIKPENIFLDEEANQVQIGDFGLAKLGLNNPSNANISTTSLIKNSSSIFSKTTKWVGTYSYAAPEQIENRETNPKSDIYSLGIVLLELLCYFQTDMERYKTIETLRNRNHLPETIREKWPVVADLILKMVAANHCSRPTASEVLSALDENEKSSQKENLSRCNSCESCSQELTVAELRSEIEDLKRQLAEKNAMIERLTTSK